MTGYVLSNRWEREAERLDALTDGYDGPSLEFCRSAGLCPGARVLEVGPGTGRFAQLLADAVGPSGEVVAVDIDTSLSEALPGRTFTVVHGDLREGQVPDGPFDLVHARLVIGHLPDRAAAIRSLVQRLRPGGWLVIEDFDRVTSLTSYPGRPAYERVADAIWAVLGTGSFDGLYGRSLPAALDGLEDVEAVGAVELLQGDPERGVPKWELLQAQLGAPLRNIVSDADLAAFAAIMRDPAVTMLSPLLVRARGRRPVPQP